MHRLPRRRRHASHEPQGAAVRRPGSCLNGARPVEPLPHRERRATRDMPGNDWLRPDQRYDVIHYVREELPARVEPGRSTSRSTTPTSTCLPKGCVARTRPGRARARSRATSVRRSRPSWGTELERRDSPCASTDDAADRYDLQTHGVGRRSWTGGFLDLANTQHYQQRGEGNRPPGGEPLLDGLDGLGLGSYGGKPGLGPRSAPGRAGPGAARSGSTSTVTHGSTASGSCSRYAIDGREVLELPRHRPLFGPARRSPTGSSRRVRGRFSSC